MCKHERVEPGPTQHAFSWQIPTEVCLDCEQWRPVLIPNGIWRDQPIPQGTPADDLRAYAERLAERDLADFQGPTGDCADMRAGIVLARSFLASTSSDVDQFSLARHFDSLRRAIFENAPGVWPDWVYEARSAVKHQADSSWLPDLLSALGWQGGTIHQAIGAVRRMVESEKERDRR